MGFTTATERNGQNSVSIIDGEQPYDEENKEHFYDEMNGILGTVTTCFILRSLRYLPCHCLHIILTYTNLCATV